MNVAVIGCGNIGRRRAQTVCGIDGLCLVAVSDAVPEAAQAVAAETGAEAHSDWEHVVTRKDVDFVIISTPNDLHASIAIAAMESGKDVLCEKPLAVNPTEAKRMVDAAARTGRKLKTGFNHRYFPAIIKARELYDAGCIGDIMFIRCRYGHGGRAGYDKVWFTDKARSGGGTFLDNGVHALDLFRWFMGDFAEATGFVETAWWDVAPCEDSGFGVFRTADQKVASLNASWTQWKSIFSFEIYGTLGWLDVQSAETLQMGLRDPNFGPPQGNWFDFTGRNQSWLIDTMEMMNAIKEDRQPLASGYDGWQAVRMAYGVYEASLKGMTAKL